MNRAFNILIAGVSALLIALFFVLLLSMLLELWQQTSLRTPHFSEIVFAARLSLITATLSSIVALVVFVDFDQALTALRSASPGPMIAATLVFAVGLLVGFRAWRSDPSLRWVVAGGAAAWLRHFVLDSFYSHGLGVRIFWLFSDASLNLAIPWFHVLQREWSPDSATLRIFGTEALCYGALLGACLIWRRHRKRV